MSNERILVSVELADKAAQKALLDFIEKSGTADKAFKKLKDSGQSTFNEIAIGIGKSSGIYDIFAGNIAANLVTKGFEVMAAAAGRLFNLFVTDGIRAAQESEDALNSLNVALAQSGQYSEATSKEFVNFAKSLQQTTAFEDDAIIKNAALIQSLAQLDKDGLKRATAASLDLSAALGKDLTTASEAIAKAAQGNFVALNKMGIQFEKSGNQARDFDTALQLLEDKFGGAAASKLNTFSGALEQTKNNFGDLQEEVGNLIITNPAIIAALSELSKIIKEIATSGFGGANGARTLAQAFITVIDVTNFTIKIFNGLAVTVLTVWDTVVAATATAIARLIAPFALFSDTAKALFDGLHEQANESLNKIGDRFVNGGPLGSIVSGFDRISESAGAAMETIGTGAEKAGPKVTNLTGHVSKLTDEQRKSRDEANKYTQELADQNSNLKSNYERQVQDLKSLHEQKLAEETAADDINYTQKLERERLYFDEKQRLLSENLEKEKALVAESTLGQQTKDAANLELERKYQTNSLKLKAEFAKKQDDIDKARVKQEQEYRMYAITATGNLFTSLGQLAASGGKQNFEIVKAFNIAAAITNAYAAITKTLSDGGPYPLNLVNAAAIGISAFANVAQISSQQAPSFEHGGIIPGNMLTGDNVRVNANSREMILTTSQQAELFKIANGQGSNTGLNQRLDAMIGAFYELASRPINVSVDGREIFNLTRSQLASGRSY